MSVRSVLVVVLVAAALAGCGRRGDLEAPDTAAVTSAPAQAPANDASPLDPGSNPAPATQPPPPPPQARHFPLDFLI